MAYSIDLRKKVVESADNGMRITDASKLFKIGRKVIYNWFKLRQTTNQLAPKSGYQKGHSHKITVWERFREFAKINCKLTSSKMAIEQEKITSVKMSKIVIQRALKKIGYTSKKTFGYIEANVDKRNKFLEEINHIDPEPIVNSDGTEIDDNEGYSTAGIYEAYVENVLAPALKPGMVVIIDNASFHKSKKLARLVEAVDCRIIFYHLHTLQI